ncbi:hypothetical protein GCM10009634_48090 [Saccharothrix xinjiangensis]
MWRALLSPHQLDLTPFRSLQEQGTRRRSALGLPLAVLAHVQLYTTNYRPEYYGKGHSPYCSHARRQDSLDMGYDLLSVAELLVLEQPDWCGKCGGYAVRRLDDVQLRYYRSAHRLLEISEQLDRRRKATTSRTCAPNWTRSRTCDSAAVMTTAWTCWSGGKRCGPCDRG